MKKSLRHGYTTGACAAAASKGAALMLREQRLMEGVEIILPTGDGARFRLHGQEFTENFAACFVVKDAGDDPDVTNGAEIHARISLVGAQHPAEAAALAAAAGCCAPTDASATRIIIEGGVGVGRVTKPGLAVPVGEWAINPVPRRMIEEAVREVFPVHHSSASSARAASRLPELYGGQVAAAAGFTIHCLLSIPNGEELAKKTLNSRLGILGGLSILGTTGIVKPISAKAWTDTIDAAIDVARACGCETVVLATGRTSEMVAQTFFGIRDSELGIGKGFNEEAYIMMGDHVGYALRACAAKGVLQVIIAGQFAKLLKIACGHEQTHVSSSELDLQALAAWLDLDPSLAHLAPTVRTANTARQILEGADHDPQLIGLVCEKLKAFAKKLAPRPVIKVFLAGYGGEVLYCA